VGAPSADGGVHRWAQCVCDECCLVRSISLGLGVAHHQVLVVQFENRQALDAFLESLRCLVTFSSPANVTACDPVLLLTRSWRVDLAARTDNLWPAGPLLSPSSLGSAGPLLSSLWPVEPSSAPSPSPGDRRPPSSSPLWPPPVGAADLSALASCLWIQPSSSATLRRGQLCLTQFSAPVPVPAADYDRIVSAFEPSCWNRPIVCLVLDYLWIMPVGRAAARGSLLSPQ